MYEYLVASRTSARAGQSVHPDVIPLTGTGLESERGRGIRQRLSIIK
jgi:hypothetical protein